MGQNKIKKGKQKKQKRKKTQEKRVLLRVVDDPPQRSQSVALRALERSSGWIREEPPSKTIISIISILNPSITILGLFLVTL